MRKNFILITGLVLAAALLTALAGAAGLQAASVRTVSAQTVPTEMPRTISVTGNGKVSVVPDIAYINIGVHTENADAAEAVGSNNSQSEKVATALRALGIASKDIQTTNFSIYPMQQFDPQGKVTGINYAVDNTVFVTLRDIDKLGDVIGGAVDAGANSINSIQFDVEDRSEALSEAREAAVADAQAQARELASIADVTLGEIQTINSYGGQPIPFFEARGLGGGAPALDSQVPISPGQLVVTVDVNVVFGIE